MADIKEFVASFADSGVNLAHANRFSIQGDAAPGTPKTGPKNPVLNQLVREVTMAGKSIGTYVYRNIESPIKMPYDIIHNEVTLTFMDTEYHDCHRFYTAWMREVYDDNEEEVGYGYYRDYVRTLQVYQHSKATLNPTYGVVYQNCYPIIISDISLSNESSNTWTTFSVTLTYETVQEQTVAPTKVSAPTTEVKDNQSIASYIKNTLSILP